MPPLYDYECSDCNRRMSVLRSIHEGASQPSSQEEKDELEEGEEVSCPAHKWVRVYSGKAPGKAYGSNWTGAKGYW